MYTLVTCIEPNPDNTQHTATGSKTTCDLFQDLSVYYMYLSIVHCTLSSNFTHVIIEVDTEWVLFVEDTMSTSSCCRFKFQQQGLYSYSGAGGIRVPSTGSTTTENTDSSLLRSPPPQILLSLVMSLGLGCNFSPGDKQKIFTDDSIVAHEDLVMSHEEKNLIFELLRQHMETYNLK